MNIKLGELLIFWYARNKRNLPWRKTKVPYLIWISEVILQQTRVDQGLDYYLKFVKRFPTILSLASATEEEVLKYWQGLGYYSRARNLHATATYIRDEKDGRFPHKYDEILKLKGIGPYTSAAISSISFGLPYPVIDGNVTRVISRIFGIKENVNSSEGLNKIEKKLKSIFISESPGDFNQAIMELGALVCKPSNPDCAHCVLSTKCIAFKQNLMNDLPNKTKARSPKNIYLYYLVMKFKKENIYFVYFNKRQGNTIWKNLYDFPRIELQKKEKKSKIFNRLKQSKFLIDSSFEIGEIMGPIEHKLSHRNIYAYFISISLDGDLEKNNEEQLVDVNELEYEKLPVPKLIENYIKKYHNWV